jgi:hypothetical protein
MFVGGPATKDWDRPKTLLFSRWDVTVVQSRNDCAVRERNLALAIGPSRYIVAQNGSKTVEVAFFVGHGDQLPVAVSGGNTGYENRGGLCIGVCGSERDIAAHHRDRNE